MAALHSGPTPTRLEQTMGREQKVVIITGASQGIGAGLVIVAVVLMVNLGLIRGTSGAKNTKAATFRSRLGELEESL